MESAQPQPFDVPKEPKEEWQGLEIASDATERLINEYVGYLRSFMESFYKNAGLAELIFLHDVLNSWDLDYAGVITRRCQIADLMLARLGYNAEGLQHERIRYHESDRVGSSAARKCKGGNEPPTALD